jgi:regulator of RNase E activity RraA
MDIRVEFAGVSVSAGDFVIADRSGVVFVPRDVAEKVVGLAERIARREEAMLEAVSSGESVVKVMHDDRFPRVEVGVR